MSVQKNQIFIIVSLILFCLVTIPVFAQKIAFQNYYASIKSGEVNVRIGPNVRYPIQWIFVKKNEPIEVVAIFEQWRKIRDINGDEGWINASMLSSKRYAVTIGDAKIILYKKADKNSSIIAEAEPGIRASLLKCKEEMCNIEIGKIKAWVLRKNLWGLYKDEEIK